ncbi:AI-2E family transporter [Segnochrobactraceae bacterium EtOH-i3]
MQIDTPLSRGIHTLIAVITTVLVGVALYFGQSVFAPVVFAMFVIAIVWPVQKFLQRYIPAGLAMLITSVLTLCVIMLLSYMVIIGFTRAAHWLAGNTARFQEIYIEIMAFLEEQGIATSGLVTSQISAGSLIRLLQGVASGVNALAGFTVVTLVYVILGLLEVGVSRAKLVSLSRNPAAANFLAACEEIAKKLRRYMIVRTVISILTGVLVWLFGWAIGLDLAEEWGMIAFVLNYIPFIGPVIATVLPTIFALVQFEAWQTAVLTLVGMNLIQFICGSYLEPRVTGTQLSMSPFMVLFAIFLWAFLWGIPGAFIGVPVMIAVLTICAQDPRSRWVAELLSSDVATPEKPDRPEA